MAPEAFTSLDQTPKMDVWSLGIVVLQVLDVLPSCNIKNIWKEYAKWHGVVIGQVDRCLPQLKPMLHIGPSKRYSAKQCAQNIFHSSASKNWTFYVPGLHENIDVPVTGLTTMLQALSPGSVREVPAEIHPFRQFGGGVKSKPSASSGGRNIRRSASAMDWQPDPPAQLPQNRRQSSRATQPSANKTSQSATDAHNSRKTARCTDFP